MRTSREEAIPPRRQLPDRIIKVTIECYCGKCGRRNLLAVAPNSGQFQASGEEVYLTGRCSCGHVIVERV